MTHTRAELIAHIRTFAEIWRERQTIHPDPVVRYQAVLTTAMYDDSIRAADGGAPLSVICGYLSGERAAIHGCKGAIEAEREAQKVSVA